MDAMSTLMDFFTQSEGDSIKIGSPDAYSKFMKRVKELYKLGELQEILDCEDNMLIIAGAGSGKTTSLLLKILRDIASGRLVSVTYQNGQPIYKLKKILIATFLRTGAEDLRQKFDELCKNFKIVGISSKDLSIRTLDSEILECYKKLYEQMGMAVEVNIVTERDTKTFVREACDYYKIRSLTGRGKRLSDDELSDIECMLSYYRNRLDNGKFNHPLMSEYNLNEVTINGIIERVKQLKKLNGLKDFVDLEEEIYKAYSINPKVAEFVASRYDYVYLDEFQDTSQLQYGYLLPYLRGAEGFIITGDDDQCFPCNFKVSTTIDTSERISKIKKDMKVLTVVDRENLMEKVVDVTSKKYIKSDIIEIKTKSGKILAGTKEHIIFTRFNPLEDVYTVYLMYRDDFGFRIGLASGNRLDGHGGNRLGIAQRLNKEKGDKVWILKECKEKKDGLYWEKYFSQKYGIPTYMFKIEKEYNVKKTEDDIRKMHQSINSFSRGFQLLNDIGYNFDYSHFLPKVREDKCAIYLTMFGGWNISANGVRKSILSVDTTNEHYVNVIGKHLSVCRKSPTSRNPYWSCSNTTSYIDLQEKKLKEIVADCNSHNLPLIVKKQARIGDNRYDFMPLCNVVKGMIVPIVVDGEIREDEIISVKRKYFEGDVFDVSVPETRNFVVNSMIVHNCIYSWRGSDIGLIKENVSKDFNPTIKFLTVNRRCPENILNPVIPSITENSFRHPKNLKSAKDGGQVDIIIDGGVQYLLDSLKNDLEKSEKIGILGRTNADLLVPTLVLLLNKYNSFSVSQQVSFKSGFAKKILGSMQLVLHRYNEDFEDYLRQFVGKEEYYQITKLCDTLASCKNESIYTLPLEDLQYSTPGLFYLFKMLRENRDDPVGAYVKMLSYMETDAYRGKTIYAKRARDFIYYLRKLILEHPTLKGKTIEELFDIFNNQLPSELEKKMLKREYKLVNNKRIYYTPEDNSYVRITTIHDAKGKEWDNVYIWNDIDGCFPNSVGSRDLSEEEFEEERRVHYIAWTRAKKKLTVFTRSDVAAGFLGECDLENCNIYQLKESKAGVRDIESVLNKQYFKNKSNTINTEEDKPTKSWKDCFREYVAKYSSYEKIGSKEGNNLDICFTKLGGMDKVADYLLSCKIDCYPVEEIEGAISDLLESKVLSME